MCESLTIVSDFIGGRYCWLEVVAQSGSYAELYDSIIALLTNQSTHFQQQPILSSNVQLDLLQTTYAFLE